MDQVVVLRIPLRLFHDDVTAKPGKALSQHEPKHPKISVDFDDTESQTSG